MGTIQCLTKRRLFVSFKNFINFMKNVQKITSSVGTFWHKNFDIIVDFTPKHVNPTKILK